MIRPNKHLKPLQKPVVACIFSQCAVDVTSQLARLNTAQYGQGERLNANGPAADSVECVSSDAVPCLKVKFTVALTSLSVKLPKPACQFIAKQKNSVGIVSQ